MDDKEATRLAAADSAGAQGADEFGRWAAEATSSDGFWASTPTWRPTTGRSELGGDLVVWTDQGVFMLGLEERAVASHLDGSVSLAELAEDFAFAAETSEDHAREFVSTLVVELSSLEAIEGGVLQALPAAGPDDVVAQPSASQRFDLGESTMIDPETGSEIRVVTAINHDGNRVTTEFLPDGRRRITTETEISAGPGPEGVTGAEALAGKRSMAELVPIESCLGSKLRNFDDIALVSMAGSDGRVCSVRCHSPEVANALRVLAGDAVVSEGERGPIEAFVVTPLEGMGPMRIYDGRGRRRGRPRSVGEAAAIVDQVLGERINGSQSEMLAAEMVIPLGLVLIGGPAGEAVLTHLDALDNWGLAQRLSAAGWTITWGRAELDPGGRIRAPSAFGRPAVVADDPEVLVPGGAGLPVASRLARMLGPAEEVVDRTTTLDRVLPLCERLRWVALNAPLGSQLGIDLPTPLT